MVTAAGRATMRSAITSQDSRASEIGASKGWKHLTRQLPISGQTFCEQSGDDFIGFWQDISPLVSAIDISWETAVCVPAIAKAEVAARGMDMSAPSMAIMPSVANQRWKSLFLTGLKLAQLGVVGNPPSGIRLMTI